MGLHPVFANMQISSPVVKVHCMLTDQKVIFAHSGWDIDPLYMDFIQLKFKSWRIIQPLDIDQNEMVIIPDNFLKYKYSAK